MVPIYNSVKDQAVHSIGKHICDDSPKNCAIGYSYRYVSKDSKTFKEMVRFKWTVLTPVTQFSIFFECIDDLHHVSCNEGSAHQPTNVFHLLPTDITHDFRVHPHLRKCDI